VRGDHRPAQCEVEPLPPSAPRMAGTPLVPVTPHSYVFKRTEFRLVSPVSRSGSWHRTFVTDDFVTDLVGLGPKHRQKAAVETRMAEV
jgi:hypothetical protein